MRDEAIVVTLQAEDYCCDFELPANVVLGELYPRLLTVLQKASNRVFGGWIKLVLETEEGALLDEMATLLDYGICTGYYLSVKQEE